MECTVMVLVGVGLVVWMVVILWYMLEEPE